jgi:hypothetical protein
MAKIVSGRVKKTPQSGINSDRYQFLGLEQAEPDLGDPIIGVSSVGINPYIGNISDLYFLVSDNTGSGNRYWAKQTDIISNGVFIPGSITVRDAGVIVGGVNQVTDINFVSNEFVLTNPSSWVGAGSSSIDISLQLPTLRTGISTVATVGQTEFTTSYNVGFVDVYINGIRLTESDYVASNGTSIILNNSCFGGEVIDILSYATVSTGSGSSEGSTINYYSYWSSNNSGIHTTSNVGIGTTNATSKLTIIGGDVSVGLNTSHGVILTSPNGTAYRLIVDDSGNLSTTAV